MTTQQLIIKQFHSFIFRNIALFFEIPGKINTFTAHSEMISFSSSLFLFVLRVYRKSPLRIGPGSELITIGASN